MLIVLSAIVKNESKAIGRMLRSVASLIDEYVIVDTGSTDGTPAIIAATMADLGIPGRVVEGTFLNFAQARNEALEEARHRTQERWNSLKDVYLLLLDADHELHVAPDMKDFPWEEHDAYHVQQRDGGFVYDNLRIVRADVAAKYVGYTHEYMDLPQGTKVGRVPPEKMWIEDHGDGGSKGNKFERDVELLTKQWKESGEKDLRAAFYLGNSYFDMGKYDKAETWYTKRLEFQGWDEEDFYARYRLGQAQLEQGRAEGVNTLLEAYNQRPSRGEPLYKLARHYRLKGKNHLGYMFADAAYSRSLPGDRLFVEKAAYTWGPEEEMSITGFYLGSGQRWRGRRKCFQLSTDPMVPEHVRNQARYNSHFYAESLQDYLMGGTEKEIPNPHPEPYLPSNPSVFVHNDVLKINVRGVNYSIDENGGYHMRDPEGKVRTVNRVWEPEAGLYLTPDPLRDYRKDARIQGMEDVRPFVLEGKLGFFCTVADMTEDGIPKMAVYHPRDGFHLQTWGNACEKNWLPLVKEDTLYAVYSTDPFVLLKWNGTQMEPHMMTRNPKLDLTHLRGSSQVIPFRGGWLYVAHEVTQFRRRSYLHRFVYLNRDFVVESVSDPFYFHTPRDIEFCCGLAQHEGKLYVSYGVLDNAAYHAELDPTDVANVVGLCRFIVEGELDDQPDHLPPG